MACPPGNDLIPAPPLKWAILIGGFIAGEETRTNALSTAMTMRTLAKNYNLLKLQFFTHKTIPSAKSACQATTRSLYFTRLFVQRVYLLSYGVRVSV